MKSDFWRRFFDLISSRRVNTGDRNFAETISRARDHIASDFPNPAREGCPAQGSVFNSFRSGKMPRGEDRAHILSCSECFNEYQIQLAEYRAANRVVKQAPGWSRIAIPALAFGLVILAVAIIVWKVSMRPRGDGLVASHSPTPSVSPSSSNPITSSSVNPNPNLNKPEDESQKQSTNLMIAANHMTIDFEQAIALRRLSSQQSKTIRLSPTPYAFLIKLPDNSPRGSYTVTLDDAFGKSVRSKIAVSPSGKTVKVTLNLTGLNSGGYSICVTREQEVPNCLPVTVRTH